MHHLLSINLAVAKGVFHIFAGSLVALFSHMICNIIIGTCERIIGTYEIAIGCNSLIVGIKLSVTGVASLKECHIAQRVHHGKISAQRHWSGLCLGLL